MTITGITWNDEKETEKAKTRTSVRHWERKAADRMIWCLGKIQTKIYKKWLETKQVEQTIRGDTKTFNRGRPEEEQEDSEDNDKGQSFKAKKDKIKLKDWEDTATEQSFKTQSSDTEIKLENLISFEEKNKEEEQL